MLEYQGKFADYFVLVCGDTHILRHHCHYHLLWFKNVQIKGEFVLLSYRLPLKALPNLLISSYIISESTSFEVQHFEYFWMFHQKLGPLYPQRGLMTG